MIDIKMQPTEAPKLSPKITVIGVGGAGGNAVNNMLASDLEGCEFLVCNTDAQALNGSLAAEDHRIQLGPNVTGGLGAGSKPEIGKVAAEESMDELMRYLEGANMVFVTAGMGGGTGTGAAPVIAKACRDQGILTVGVVTKPFHFEGSHRMKSAEAGIEEMQNYVDTLIVIPNQNLFRVANENTTFADAFQMADSVLQAGVRGVTDLMVRPGLVNLDFADIRTAMLEMGKAMMGTGEADGDKRAIEAAESAINNPLLDDVSMKGAHGVIINVTGGYDMTLFEADEACNRIRDEVDPEANIIFGATFDQSLEGKMRVSIVATGIEKESATKNKTGGGSIKVDANSRTLLERATPKTENAEKAESPIQSNVHSQPATAQQMPYAQPKQTSLGITAPSVAAQSEPKRDTEVDMFEQSEFAQNTSGSPQPLPENTAMRGTRYNDSFIPPKPIEAAGIEAPHISNFDAAHVPQSSAQPGSVASSPMVTAKPSPNTPSLKLNPPVQPNPEKKRSPSLFERITGSVQDKLEEISGKTEQDHRERREPSPQFVPSQSAQQKAPPPLSQGSLNIDSPSKPASQVDDELDIPAFLRRQAN
ncbi:MAG: cell division protein FtsZ [Bdellovibrionales bacterium]